MADPSSLALGGLKCLFSQVDSHNFFCPVREWNNLKGLMRQLENIKKDVVKESNEQAKELLMEVKEQVKHWMSEVDGLADENLRSRAEEWSYWKFVCCCCNYMLAEAINEKLKVVKRLEEQYKNFHGQYVNQLDSRGIKEALEKEVKDLMNLRDDTEMEIQHKETQESVDRSSEAKQWLQDVATQYARYQNLPSDLDPNDDKHGKEAKEILLKVRELCSKRPSRLVVVHTTLENILGGLKDKRSKLKAVREDMESIVLQRESEPLKQRSREVKWWMENVDDLLQKIQHFFSYMDSPDDSSNASSSMIQQQKSNCQIRREATDMVDNVDKRLRERKDLDENIVVDTPPHVPEASSSSKPLVGMEDNLLEVQNFLEDENINILGIYGLGGIGKTSLLKEIRKRYVGLFKCIFVVVSKDQDILKVQEKIGEALGYKRGSLPSEQDQRAEVLRTALSQKKFLLLLDDVWEKLELEEVGIPVPDKNKKSKVILTTREEIVCIEMGARRKKLNFLNEKMSQLLFQQVADNKVILEDKEIERIANEIVKKCGGLPLVLITVGRAMANKKSVEAWRHAKRQLDYSSHEIKGMEDVLVRLKFSFDNLKDDTTRSRLLFCCLFPEDKNIGIERLVEYWIGEGLLADNNVYGQNSLSCLRDKGKFLIQDLQSSCLLEQGDDKDCVKLHDAVRDMGIWLGRGEVNFKHKFLCFAGEKLQNKTVNREWNEMERISLMDSEIKIVCGNATCHGDDLVSDHVNLLTLLVANNYSFGMPQLDCLSHLLTHTLLVLDLSYTEVDRLPFGGSPMKALRYLKLSWSRITKLHLGNFPNLKLLDLSGTTRLASIFIPASNTEPNLQSLDINHSGYDIFNVVEGQLGLKDLEGMFQLEELSLQVHKDYDTNLIEYFLKSKRLTEATRGIAFDQVKGFTIDHISIAIEILRNLEKMSISCCPLLRDKHITFHGDQLEYLQDFTVVAVGGFSIMQQPPRVSGVEDTHLPLRNLQTLFISNCPNVAGLDCLSCLKSLSLVSCEGVEELLINTNLRFLQVSDVPKLSSISPSPLPSLETLIVFDCPLLKKLHLPTNTNIRCVRKWWDCLELESKDAKSSFESRGRVDFEVDFELDFEEEEEEEEDIICDS